jgi:hypothetical protein
VARPERIDVFGEEWPPRHRQVMAHVPPFTRAARATFAVPLVADADGATPADVAHWPRSHGKAPKLLRAARAYS